MPRTINKALAVFESNIEKSKSLELASTTNGPRQCSKEKRLIGRLSKKKKGGQHRLLTSDRCSSDELSARGEKVNVFSKRTNSGGDQQPKALPTHLTSVAAQNHPRKEFSPQRPTQSPSDCPKAICNSPTGSTEELSEESPVRIQQRPQVSCGRQEPVHSNLRYSPFAKTQPKRLEQRKKCYPKSPMPAKGKLGLAQLSPSLEFSDEDSNDKRQSTTHENGHILVHDAKNKVLSLRHCNSDGGQHHRPVRRGHQNPVVLRSVSSPHRRRVALTSDPVELLSRRWRPPSILLPALRKKNTRRRVRFADMQPGGGRRMSLDSNSAGSAVSRKDVLPQRPRRLSLQMNDLKQSYPACGKGIGCDFRLAATKIQSMFRGWKQWRSARVQMLQLRLARIERLRESELKRITIEKWAAMESVRDEMKEEGKRLTSQVELGDKLIEHLKRDNAQIADKTKRLSEHCRTLERNVTALDASVKIGSQNFDAVCSLVEVLQANQDRLKEERRDCRNAVESLHAEIKLVTLKVKHEFKAKIWTKESIGKMVDMCQGRGDGSLASQIALLAATGKNTAPPDDASPSRSVSKLTDPSLLKAPISDETSILSDVTNSRRIQPASIWK